MDALALIKSFLWTVIDLKWLSCWFVQLSCLLRWVTLVKSLLLFLIELLLDESWQLVWLFGWDDWNDLRAFVGVWAVIFTITETFVAILLGLGALQVDVVLSHCEVSFDTALVDSCSGACTSQVVSSWRWLSIEARCHHITVVWSFLSRGRESLFHRSCLPLPQSIFINIRLCWVKFWCKLLSWGLTESLCRWWRQDLTTTRYPALADGSINLVGNSLLVSLEFVKLCPLQARWAPRLTLLFLQSSLLLLHSLNVSLEFFCLSKPLH